jgi:hypothetical protein
MCMNVLCAHNSQAAVFARLPTLASLSLNHNAIAAVGEINSSTDFTALEVSHLAYLTFLCTA